MSLQVSQGVTQAMALKTLGIDVSRITAYFQAIMDLENWKVTGVEALARTEEGESAFPLLARAKAEGWYDSIELPLVETAVRAAEQLPRNLLVTLNMSAKSVFSEELGDIFAAHPERAWGIEILEDSARVYEFEAFRRRVDELGCVLLMDDAGEGNSDEYRIHYLKPSVVKLDRLLLLRAMHGPEGRERLESLVKEARANHCMLLAEGVETIEQLNFALELGCEYAQGWYFGQAVPASEVAGQIADLEQRLWIDAP